MMLKLSEVGLSDKLQTALISVLSAGIGAGGMKLYDYIADKKKAIEDENEIVDPFMVQR